MSEEKQPSLLENRNPSIAVRNELTRLDELKSQLEIMCEGDVDEQLLLDTIEGETDIQEMLLEVDDRIAEYESNAAAIKMRIDDLTKRMNRNKRTAETLRTIILSAMDKAGIKKIESPQSTITLKAKARALQVNDEAEIPAKYWKPADPVLDKKGLIADLKENITVPGASLDNGGILLQIKRS